jgi:hypothetical protein
MMKIKRLCSWEVLPPFITITLQGEENLFPVVKNEWRKSNFR